MLHMILWGFTALAGLAAAAVGLLAYLFLPRKERPKTGLPCIVCIGDSITFGHGVALTRGRDVWPRILGRKLAGRWEVLNYGICGASLLRSADQPYDPSFWDAAKALKAEKYLLMLGSNDSKPGNWNREMFRKELAERVSELRALPEHPEIILMAPPPAFRKNASDRYAAFKIDNSVLTEIHDIVLRCAEENQLHFFDLFILMDGHPEYMSDGVHPNREGNRVIAEHLFRQLSSNT